MRTLQQRQSEPAAGAGQSPQTLEERLAAVIASYDAQGDHRTGTLVDSTSAEWLARQVNDAGATAELEDFPLRRVNPKACYLLLEGRRIDALPMFDHAFTGPDGIEGSFGPLGSDADICLATDVMLRPGPAKDPTKTDTTEFIEQAQAHGHKAAVVVSSGARPGLSLLNAPAFRSPSGIPVLQLSTTESDWLRERVRAGLQAKLVAQVTLTETQAFNVTARIAGSDPTLAPLIVTTPRSGWWHCANERGGGLGCWLATMRTLAAAHPERDCHFAAFSGHELGLLGGESYVAGQPKVVRRLYRWIHFGANLGAPGRPLLVQSSDDGLRRWAEEILAQHDVELVPHAGPAGRPRGEASLPHRMGIPFIAPISESDVFHNPSDRWPDAVDISAVTKVAQAFSYIALQSAMNSA